MLKCLAILALWFGCAGIMAGQPNQAGDSKNNAAEHVYAETVSAPSANHDSNAENAAGNASNNSFDWHAAAERPEWWLVLLGFITCVVIGWQSIETHQSVNEAKISSEAALMAARSVVNIERPWIVVTAKSYGHWRFQFEATNRGKSPAEIVAIANDWQIVKGMSKPTPQYTMRNAMNPRMVFPEDPPYLCGACNVGDLLMERPDAGEIASGEAGLFMMYGKVLYYDLLNRVDPPHETKFCFYWSATDPETVDDRSGPDEYVGYS